MKLWQIISIGLIALVAVMCRQEEELQIETGKGQYGVVSVRNNKRTPLIAFAYEEIRIVPGGKYFWAKEKGKWGVINRKHQRIVPFLYDTLIENHWTHEIYFGRKSGKYAIVSLGEKCCYSEAVYDSAWSVPNAGLSYAVFTFVTRNRKMGLYSPECKEILPPIYDTIIWTGGDAWHEAILYSFNGKCGMVNAKGEKIIPIGYDSIAVRVTDATNDGARAVWLNDSLAFYNKKGKPFTGKFKWTKREDYDRWWGDAEIGCRSCR